MANNLVKICKTYLDKFNYSIINTQKYGVYDKETSLVIEKGKYMVTKRDDTAYDIVQDFTNDISTYDHIWSSMDFLINYHDNDRMLLYKELGQYLFVNEIIKDKKNVIDVGAGSGEFLKSIKEKAQSKNIYVNIYGIDFSPRSIKLCQEKIPDGVFKVGNIHKLPVDSKYFDVVVCMEVLEHIQFVETALLELMRICAPGGHIIVTIPNGKVDSWIGHINFWSEKAFLKILQRLELNIKYFKITRNYYMVFVVNK